MTSPNAIPDPRKATPKRHFGHLVMPPVAHPPGKVEKAYEVPRRPIRWLGFWVLLGFIGGLTSVVLLSRGLQGKAKGVGCACATGGKAGACGQIPQRVSPPQPDRKP